MRDGESRDEKADQAIVDKWLEQKREEKCWVKPKTALRQARTRHALDAALKQALQTITPTDAQALVHSLWLSCTSIGNPL